jgi:hypothetical protein
VYVRLLQDWTITQTARRGRRTLKPSEPSSSAGSIHDELSDLFPGPVDTDILDYRELLVRAVNLQVLQDDTGHDDVDVSKIGFLPEFQAGATTRN